MIPNSTIKIPPNTTTACQPLWAEVKVSQWGATIIRYCKTCGEVHTVKDPYGE